MPFDPARLAATPAPASGGFDPARLARTPKPTGGIWNALSTKDLESASKLDPLAQAARLGQFANRGNQELAGVIAEGSGQMEARRSADKGDAVEFPVPRFLAGGQSGQTVQMGALPGIAAAGTLATASEFLLPQNRLGVAAYLLSPAMKAYQAVRGTSTGLSKPGIVAQLGMARTKVPAGDIQQAINDPSVFNAPSVAEANAQYGQSMGPLQGAAKSLRQQTGKTLLSEADWSEAINRPGRILAGTEMVPETPVIAQKINRIETPIASRIVPKSEVSQSASGIIPENVNVPTSSTNDVSEDLRRIVDLVKRARGEGVNVKSIMTDSERSLYDRFYAPIESAAEHNVPLNSLLTKGEMTRPASGFAGKTVLRPGNPIYAGSNKYEFGGTINDVKYTPGSIVNGPERLVPEKMTPQTALEGIQSINRFMRNKVNTAKLDKEQVGELLAQKEELIQFLENNGTPGMRAAASTLRKAHVKENLSRIMPQNKFGGTDALRTMGAGATAAGAASLALAGHPLAAIPLGLEALTASPAFLGGAIRNYQAASNPAVAGLAARAAALAALRSQRQK